MLLHTQDHPSDRGSLGSHSSWTAVTWTSVTGTIVLFYHHRAQRCLSPGSTGTGWKWQHEGLGAAISWGGCAHTQHCQSWTEATPLLYKSGENGVRRKKLQLQASVQT